MWYLLCCSAVPAGFSALPSGLGWSFLLGPGQATLGTPAPPRSAEAPARRCDGWCLVAESWRSRREAASPPWPAGLFSPGHGQQLGPRSLTCSAGTGSGPDCWSWSAPSPVTSSPGDKQVGLMYFGFCYCHVSIQTFQKCQPLTKLQNFYQELIQKPKKWQVLFFSLSCFFYMWFITHCVCFCYLLHVVL